MTCVEGKNFIIRTEKQAKVQASGNTVTPTIIKDKETGVEYIAIISVYGVAITPRIKPEKTKLSIEKLQ